jgi:transposase-like protein
VLVELGVVEQRYRAVLEVLEDGAPVTEVARRYGVARQTVHEWLARYAAGGLGGLADRSSRPVVGFQNSATALELAFYAARSYSLMRLPRTGRRLTRCWERSATG